MQVLSSSVSKALILSGNPEVSETVKFVDMMDKLFDCFNVSNFTSGKEAISRSLASIRVYADGLYCFFYHTHTHTHTHQGRSQDFRKAGAKCKAIAREALKKF